MHHQHLSARRRGARHLDRQRVDRRRQRQRIDRGRQQPEQRAEPVPGLAGADEAAPIGDREVDRGQRAGRNDRRRDDDARSRLLLDHQVTADTEHARLQHRAEHLRERREPAGYVARLAIAADIFGVRLAPLVAQAGRHAHRRDHLGVAPAGFGKAVARCGQPGCRKTRPAGELLGEQRQTDEHDRSRKRRDTDPNVKGKADQEIDRNPR
jgi:hypothetical protein